MYVLLNNSHFSTKSIQQYKFLVFSSANSQYRLICLHYICLLIFLLFGRLKLDKTSPQCTYPCQNLQESVSTSIFIHLTCNYGASHFRQDVKMRMFQSLWDLLFTRQSLLSRPFLHTISLLLTENGYCFQLNYINLCTIDSHKKTKQ